MKKFEIDNFEMKNVQQDWRQYKFDSRFVEQHPVVYLLHDKKKLRQMYVGETTDAKTRLFSHEKNEERGELSNISVISSERFNKSATYDLETKLINYFLVEDKYTMLNQKEKTGELFRSSHKYYEKDYYDDLFYDIWQELIDEKIATLPAKEIELSELYKLSPFKSLSESQHFAVSEIMKNINEQLTTDSNYLISGNPGTGKSLLLVTLFYQCILENKKVGIIIPQGNLKEMYVDMIRVLSKSVNGGKKWTKKEIKEKYLITPADLWGNQTKYDILIVDEAHRLKQYFAPQALYLNHVKESGLTEVEIVKKFSTHSIFMYDPLQSIRPADVKEEFVSDDYRKYRLDTQFRVKAGNEFIYFIKELLQIDFNNKPEYYDLGDYDLRIFDNLKEMHTTIREKNTQNKIARLGAGYAFKWKSKKASNRHKYDIELDGYKLKWNVSGTTWHHSDTAINEVGSIHTLQGVDLNYAGIIIAGDIYYDTDSEKIKVNQKRYFDRNGKPVYTDKEKKIKEFTDENLKELTNYIKNIYFVLLTRGIDGLYIYVEDANLRDYIKDFFEKKLRNFKSY